jgi:phosphoribosylformimino-5-aminoimidazole carboxamide ribotide isomerase
MIIYPAIDIRGGRCVRLTQGDFSKETVFFEDPVDVAIQWESQGAEWIHVVDLDGAKDGLPLNYNTICKMCNAVKAKIQVGGGIRSLEVACKYIDAGIERIIFGSAVLEDPELVKESLTLFGAEKVAVGIDVRNNFLATRGWIKTSDVPLDEVLKGLYQIGIKRLIYTDISKDGMMAGPNFNSIKNIIDKGTFTVIASGGISKEEHLKKLMPLQEKGLEGAIIGKALYTGVLKLADVIEKFS